jgi:hypothetical protein
MKFLLDYPQDDSQQRTVLTDRPALYQLCSPTSTQGRQFFHGAELMDIPLLGEATPRGSIRVLRTLLSLPHRNQQTRAAAAIGQVETIGKP